MNKILKRFAYLISLVLLICSVVAQPVTVQAITYKALLDARNYKPWYDKNDTLSPTCSSNIPPSIPSATTGGTPISTNSDYAGNQILTQGQIQQIKLNQPVYEKSAATSSIPWQMIAVIHLRESGLGRVNPGNGQGIYQFLARQGGPYPTGAVSDSEFQRQTDIVADFIKNKASSNYAANKVLSVNATPDAVKDTFFSYNGRADVYEQQASRLGFSATTQGFEGSPYVMNKADAQRDPAVNKTTWGQVKRDRGPIEFPANGDYGAFVTYAALAGVAAGGCSSQATGSLQQVIELAKQEFAKNVTESPPGSDSGPVVSIYNNSSAQPWCAYFLSYIFRQAGKPFQENNGVIAAVESLKQYGIKNNIFHPKSEAGFVPQPGDIVIYDEGLMPYPSHANLVISYDPTTMKFTSIGGNESDGVRQNSWATSLSAITGYVRIP